MRRLLARLDYWWNGPKWYCHDNLCDGHPRRSRWDAK